MKDLKNARELNDDELEDVTGGLFFGMIDLKNLFHRKKTDPLTSDGQQTTLANGVSVQTDDFRNA